MNLLYISPYDENTQAANGGYGVVAKSFKRAFTTIAAISVDYINVNSLSINIPTILNKKYDVCIVLTHPTSFNNSIFKSNIERIFKNCDRTYLTLFWETTPLPKAWSWLWTSNLFTGFIACSQFMYNEIQEQLKHSNKENHLIYVPSFIEDYKDYHVSIKDKINEDKFTVLYIGQYTKRKGMEDAIIAFTQALSKNEDCRLILKYHELSKLEVPSNIMIESTIRMNCTDIKAQIYQLVDNLKEDQIYSLYQDSSVLFFPSRGEGYGLPLIEAGIIGIPCIYTDWSSCCEVGDFEGNVKIPYVLDTAYNMSQYGYEDNSLYAVPSISYSVEALREKHYQWKKDKKLYYQTVANNRYDITEKFGVETFTKQLAELLTK